MCVHVCWCYRVPECLPQSLQTLSLSENEVCDLNQVRIKIISYATVSELLTVINIMCPALRQLNISCGSAVTLELQIAVVY